MTIVTLWDNQKGRVYENTQHHMLAASVKHGSKTIFECIFK